VPQFSQGDAPGWANRAPSGQSDSRPEISPRHRRAGSVVHGMSFVSSAKNRTITRGTPRSYTFIAKRSYRKWQLLV
jgi:hypothetical protein